MTKRLNILSFLLFLVLTFSCEFEKRIPPRGYLPVSGISTTQLEASYFWLPQNKLNSSYWKDADFLEVSLSNLATHNLYADGYLNMTGTYNGLSDFNRGHDPLVKIKAGYDDENIYILIEWKDTTANASYMNWFYDGTEDAHKTDTSGGWTSQRNSDNFILLFDLDGSSVKDAWKWSLALTAPFDMAYNLQANNNGILSGIPDNTVRNAPDTSSRSGPAFEWNGNRQEIFLADSTRILLDPAYFLLDNHKIAFEGDPAAGQKIFNQTADCKFCHGLNGNGDFEGSEGGVLADVKTLRMSRNDLVSFISGFDHEGSGDQYWGRIKNNPTDITNLLSFLRGLAGIPGSTLIQPIINPDIKALTNIGIGTISSSNSIYKVLLIRALNTGKANNVVFTPDKVYTFSIRFSDNDDINYIGASDLQLIFKSKEL
jgi:hypothetical protein